MDGSIQPGDTWTVAGRTFTSRLIVGTGKYKDYAENAAAAEAAGAEIVTVAVRRVNLSDPNQPMLVDYVKPDRFTFLPNTAGCFTGEDAIRTLRLAREAGGWNLVKLEVLGPPPFLYPDMAATFEAAQALLADNFEVMVYCADDPVAAKRLEEMGCVAIMPLGAPIGSGMGVVNPYMIRAIKAVSTERGRDPREFALFAFGGNGPLFACGMAAALGCRTTRKAGWFHLGLLVLPALYLLVHRRKRKVDNDLAAVTETRPIPTT